MSVLRNFKYPIFIGVGVIAAGTIFYSVRSGVNAKHTRGAIERREVYRDGEVKAADVNANPGSAPVATQALMESKEFKALAKNAAFQELMASQSFQMMAQNTQFLSLLRDDSFRSLAQNGAFVQYLQNPAMAELVHWMTSNSAANLSAQGLTDHLNASLSAANAQELMKNEMFQNLFHNDAFLSLIKLDSNVQGLANMLRMDSFAGLTQNSQFQTMLSQSAFQNAMMQGAAANLSSQLSMGLRQ